MSVKNGTKTEGKDNNGRCVAGNKLGKGRPKKELCASDLIKAKGEIIREDGRSELQAVIDKLYEKATGGDLRAIEMIFDRIEGKPIQATITTFDELPDGFDMIDIG